VINRGNYHRDLFKGKGAAEAFERTLDEAAQRFHWHVHAYVVMSNHFHLAVETPEPNLSEGMKWLQGTWIRRYNGYRRLTGRPFQGRFKALIVEPGHAFGQVCHYIHLNPARARVVEPDMIASHPWSSLPKFMGKKRPGWLDAATALDAAGGLKDSPAGWKRYCRYLEFLASDDAAKKELASEKMSRGWCVGTREFRGALKAAAARKGAELDVEHYEGMEPGDVREAREQNWEERLRRFAELEAVDLGRLSPKKSDDSKVLLAAAMKRSTSVSNGWLAERLGMGEPASASQFVRRWMLDPEKATVVNDLLSRVKT
jgi:REP element-mobilizing transposase RayT